jgi:hypothetical protein
MAIFVLLNTILKCDFSETGYYIAKAVSPASASSLLLGLQVGTTIPGLECDF